MINERDMNTDRSIYYSRVLGFLIYVWIGNAIASLAVNFPFQSTAQMRGMIIMWFGVNMLAIIVFLARLARPVEKNELAQIARLDRLMQLKTLHGWRQIISPGDRYSTREKRAGVFAITLVELFWCGFATFWISIVSSAGPTGTLPWFFIVTIHTVVVGLGIVSFVFLICESIAIIRYLLVRQH